MQKVIIIFLFVFTSNILYSEGIHINKIFYDRQRVFEPEDKDWFFASEFLNFFHTTTKQYVIEDELLFKSNSITDEDYLYETERNLRNIGLFTNVRIELDSIGFDRYDAYVVTKDRWSFYPSVPFGTGGGEVKYGIKLEEFNLLGTGTYIRLEAVNRTENNIEWHGKFNIKNRRFLRTPFSVDFTLDAHKYKTIQSLTVVKPFFDLDTKYSFGTSFYNAFGSNFVYNRNQEKELVPFNEQNYYAFFSSSWYRNDKIYANGAIEFNNTDRLDTLRFAYSNSGKLLMMFSSVSQKFYPLKKVNYYDTEDMAIGGYGSATLGRIFEMGSKVGDYGFYVGGQGEISFYNGSTYLFGQLTGSTLFRSAVPKYTYQEFMGLLFQKIAEPLVLAIRVREQVTWNWLDAYRQLLLDNERGMRGYDLNQLSGDNRILTNIELRFFPDIPVWMFNFSGVIFTDIGTVWKKNQQIFDQQFYTSVGAGIRIHFTKSSNPSHTFRIDFAYNTFDKKFGGISISTKQLFSAFQNHEYRIPSVFGTEYDLE